MAMQVLHELAPIGTAAGSAVALGFFDGVHLGHRSVMRAAVNYAAAHGLAPAAFTFSLPSGNTLKGGRLLSAAEKQRRVEEAGIQVYIEPPFEAFCSLSPEAFVNEVLKERFAARAVFCGDNFTFGARAAGNVESLRTLCAQQGIEVHVVEMAQYEGRNVSSTRIRAALEEGRVEDANAMLGSPYAIDWPVVHGKGVGTSRLGAPTINQNYPAGTLRPCSGVYITRILLDGRWYPGATGIGSRPTVEQKGAAVTCETYVQGFSGNVYGQRPRLEFYKYLCPVKRFDSLAELTKLIYTAADQSKAYFDQMREV